MVVEWKGRKRTDFVEGGVGYDVYKSDMSVGLTTLDEKLATEVRRKLNFCEGVEFITNRVGGLKDLLSKAESLIHAVYEERDLAVDANEDDAFCIGERASELEEALDQFKEGKV